MSRRVAAVIRLADAIIFALMVAACPAAEVTAAQVQELLDQNRRLQEQVRAQQQTINALNAKVGDVLKATERHDRELRGLQDRVESPAPSAAGPSSNRDHEVRISAEAGVAFFSTGS